MNIDENIVKKAEKIDLSGSDINRIADGNATIMSYSDLEKIQTLNDAFKEKPCLILLYELRQGFGHWTTLTKHSDKLVEFCDSYGLTMDSELQFTSYYFNEHGVPHLTRLVRESGMTLEQNKKQFQQFKESVNTCGRFSGYRARRNDLSLKQFQSIFLGKRESPDEIITRITLSL